MAVVAGTSPNMGHVAHDFSQNPLLVYWEMTQSCGLACKHCRAEAMPKPHPLELDTAASKRFLNQLVEFGEPLPHLILTGGDPLSRKDIFPLIDYANALGLRSFPPFALRCENDGSAVLSPNCDRDDENVRDAESRDEVNLRVQGIPDSRRARHRIRFKSWRCLSVRVSAVALRKCAHRF